MGDLTDCGIADLRSPLRWLALGALCVIWGTTWIAIKIDLQSTGPLTAIGLRFVIAGTLLLAIAKWRKQTQPTTTPWGVIAILATFMFGVSYICTYMAETHLESGLVAVLFATLPFFGFGFGYVVLGERTTVFTWLGAFAALTGVALVSLSGSAHGRVEFVLYALGAAASAALGNVYAKKYSSYNPMVILPPAMVIAGAVVLLLGVITEKTSWGNVVAPSSLAALLYLAVIGSAAAFLLLLWALQRLPARIVNASSFLYPIVALMAGALLGNEHFSVRALVGTGLVLGGLFFTLR